MKLKDFAEKHGLNYEMVKSWKKRGKLNEKLREKGLAIIEGDTEDGELKLASVLKNHLPVEDPSLPKIELKDLIEDGEKKQEFYYTPFGLKWIEDHKKDKPEGWPWGLPLMEDDYLRKYEETGVWGETQSKSERKKLLKLQGLGWMLNEKDEFDFSYEDCGEGFIPHWKEEKMRSITEGYVKVMTDLIENETLKGSTVNFMGHIIFCGSKPKKGKKE